MEQRIPSVRKTEPKESLPPHLPPLEEKVQVIKGGKKYSTSVEPDFSSKYEEERKNSQ